MGIRRSDWEIGSSSVGLRLFGCLLSILVPLQSAAAGQVPSVTPTPLPIPSPVNVIDTTKPLTLAEATDLALTQASNYKAAQINELSAGEDVKQARAAFLPKVSAPLNFIYTSPSLGPTR